MYQHFCKFIAFNAPSQYVRANIDNIEDIFVTLDSHNREHIAHAKSWNTKADGSGNYPTPFTLISHADVVEGRWFPTNRANQVSFSCSCMLGMQFFFTHS